LHFSHDRNLLAIRAKACFDRGLPHGEFSKTEGDTWRGPMLPTF